MKKLYFFFRTQSLLIEKSMKNKRGLELVTSCSSGCKTRSKIHLLVMCYLTKLDDVIYSRFLVIPKKVTSANLCKPIHDIINYSIYICPFESCVKCGKERE